MNTVEIPWYVWSGLIGALVLLLSVVAYLMRRMIDKNDETINCIGVKIDKRLEKIEDHTQKLVAGMYERIEGLDRRHGDRGTALSERVSRIEARCAERHI